MKYLLSIILLFTVVCASTQTYAYNEDNAIARVYGILQGNNALSGTGFFVRIHNHQYVCTAYHVISGAKSIQLKSVDGDLINVSVAGYDERKDIALLNYATTKRTSRIEFFNLVTNLPENLTAAAAHIIGHPKTLTYSHFDVRFTNNNYIPSRQIDVFKLDLNINLIGITGTIYDGDSGAPVITSGGVIAFVSGSYNEGGTIFWAIPASYISQISILSNPIVNLGNLPALNMLRGHSNGLTRSFTVNNDVQSRYHPFVTINSNFKSNNAEFQSALNEIMQVCNDFRNKLDDCDTYAKFTVQLDAFHSRYDPLEARSNDYMSRNQQDASAWRNAYRDIQNSINLTEYSRFLRSNGSFIQSSSSQIENRMSLNEANHIKINNESINIQASLKRDGENNDYPSLWRDAYKWIDNIIAGHNYLKNSLFLQNEMIQLSEVSENAIVESQAFE